MPDNLGTEKLESLFLEVSDSFGQGCMEKQEFLDIITELMYKRNISGAILADAVRDKLDSILCGIWDTTSLDETNIILSLIVNLDLKCCYAKI